MDNFCRAIFGKVTYKVLIKKNTRVAETPRLGVGPGFDSQGSVNFFSKYCFPNLH